MSPEGKNMPDLDKYRLQLEKTQARKRKLLRELDDVRQLEKATRYEAEKVYEQHRPWTVRFREDAMQETGILKEKAHDDMDCTIGMDQSMLTELFSFSLDEWTMCVSSAVSHLESLVRRPCEMSVPQLLHQLKVASQMRNAIVDKDDAKAAAEEECADLSARIECMMRNLVIKLGWASAVEWEKVTKAENAVVVETIEDLKGMPAMIIKWAKAVANKCSQ